MKLFSKKSAADVPRRRQNPDGSRVTRATEADLEQNYTFRRNRTLTGSSSSLVNSVNEFGADMKSSRTHVHHLTYQRRRIASVLMGILIVIAVLAGLLYEITARPVVTVANNTPQDRVRYEKAIDDYLGAHPIERLRIMLNEQQLGVYLHQTVPEVLSVRQEGFAGFSATQFELTMREPVASWIIGGKQYFVDESGVSFEKNYYEMPGVSVIDKSGVQQSTGTAVASTRFLAFIGRTVSVARQQGLVVKQAVIPQGTIRELDVILEGHAYAIKFSLDRPVGEQVEDMKRAVGYFTGKGQSPEYIDVRVSGKAFYK